MLGKITTPTASIAVGKFVSFNPAVILGAESEGGAGSIEVNTSVTRIGVLAQGTASQNDILPFSFVDWRWATRGSGGCTADSTHVCPCGCRDPIPTTLYVGDSNGTHTLTNGGGGGTQTETIYDASCVPSTTPMAYSISLTSHCPDATFPNGYWQLSYGWNMRCCGGHAVYDQMPDFSFNAFPVAVSAVIDFTCTFPLTFVLPSTKSITCTAGSPDTIAVPGGGGTMIVTF
jgi:hypothetical protein